MIFESRPILVPRATFFVSFRNDFVDRVTEGNRIRDLFLEGPEKFSHLESHSKVSNLMITELFNSMII